jgi:hypothetical protein
MGEGKFWNVLIDSIWETASEIDTALLKQKLEFLEGQICQL